jgi:Helix-turn-helix domain
VIFSNSRPLDLVEAAAFLRCDPETLRRKARRAEIPGRKIGGWKFMRADLINYVSRKADGKVEAWHTGYTNSGIPQIGTSILAATAAGELDRALAPMTKNKPKPTQSIARPNFGGKKSSASA